jgi:hypothetical protein
MINIKIFIVEECRLWLNEVRPQPSRDAPASLDQWSVFNFSSLMAAGAAIEWLHSVSPLVSFKASSSYLQENYLVSLY